MSMKDDAIHISDNCGEEIVVPIDPSAGSSLEYVEDWPVCCNPNVIHVEIDEDGEFRFGAMLSRIDIDGVTLQVLRACP